MAKQPTVIILVRHGSTYLNDMNGTLRGWTDASLESKGHAEAEAAANEIGESWPTTKKLYTSNLQRAKETAEVIGRCLELHPLETVDLRPWNPGEVAGRPLKNIEKFLTYYATHQDEAPEGGEAMRTFIHRFLTFLSGVMDEAEMGLSPIVLVTSLRPIEVAIGWLESGMDGKMIELDRLTAKRESVKPGGLVVLTKARKKWNYKVIEPDEVDDENENEEDDNDNDESKPISHRPAGVFGYYKKGH